LLHGLRLNDRWICGGVKILNLNAVWVILIIHSWELDSIHSWDCGSIHSWDLLVIID
jgi:hypothetical protein